MVEIKIPENLYKTKYELENLTSEELIKTHNELVDFLYKIQDDIVLGDTVCFRGARIGNVAETLQCIVLSPTIGL